VSDILSDRQSRERSKGGFRKKKAFTASGMVARLQQKLKNIQKYMRKVA